MEADDTHTCTADSGCSQASSSFYKCGRKKIEGSLCNVMMYGCNIEQFISRRGEKKAASSRGRLSRYLPSLFTPYSNQSDGRYNPST